MESSPISVPLDQVWRLCVCVVFIFVIELANEIAEYLRRFILTLYDEHISPNGLVSTAPSRIFLNLIGLFLNPIVGCRLCRHWA